MAPRMVALQWDLFVMAMHTEGDNADEEEDLRPSSYSYHSA
jgi:hypothetical protein